MTAFFRKYWRDMIWIALLFAFVAFFIPWQKRFYLVSDWDEFSFKVRNGLLWVVLGLFCIFLVWAIVKFRQPRRVIYVGFVALLLLFSSYMLLRDCFAAAGLYVNRWADRGVVRRSYIAEYLNRDKSSEVNLSLWELPSKHLIREKDLIRFVHHIGVDQGDTVQLQLKRGVLGVAYFDSLSVHRIARSVTRAGF